MKLSAKFFPWSVLLPAPTQFPNWIFIFLYFHLLLLLNQDMNEKESSAELKPMAHPEADKLDHLMGLLMEYIRYVCYKKGEAHSSRQTLDLRVSVPPYLYPFLPLLQISCSGRNAKRYLGNYSQRLTAL